MVGRREAGWSGEERTREFDKPVGDVGDVVRFRFVTVGPDVIAYTIQYEPWIEGAHRPAVRYDSAHDYPHMDVLGWDGGVIDKVWMVPEPLDRASARAEAHLDANWEVMRGEFLRRKP